MKVLVTGAGGFIGSHLAERCVELGHEVRAFVHYNSVGSWGWLDGSQAAAGMEIVAGDIRDFDSVHAASQGVDTVFHLAALIGIPYSYVSPQAYIRTNIEGTYNVLQAARMCGIPNVVVTSTSETYGTAQYVPIDELHPAVGQSPYAASKVAADQIALSFHKSFDLPVKVVRPFNTFGPRQSARAVIPTILEKVMSGQTRIVLGNLDATRDMTFVRDTVEGFLAISRGDVFAGTATNIGTGVEISIRDLVGMISEVCGKALSIEVDPARTRPAKSEVERLLCDATRLRENSDWKPAYDLKSGLAETAEWIARNIHRYKPDNYSV